MRKAVQIGSIVAVILLLTAGAPLTAAGPFDGRSFKGRIAYSCDGNHNDPDDWSASPVALAIFANCGVKDRLVHFDYNCILPETNSEWEATHKKSVLGAARQYGFDLSVFHDCRQSLDAAVESIARAINASSADDPLFFILAGPMEVPYLGIAKSAPAKRKHVYCISHSQWNDGFASRYAFTHTKRSVIPLGVNWVQIQDQNRLLSRSRYGQPARPQEFEPYHWMRDSDDPKVRFLWECMLVSTRPDPSDAGMAYFLVSGDEQADPAKLKRLLDQNIVPAPIAERPHIRLEAENFVTLNGYELEYGGDRSVSHRLSVQPSDGGADGLIRTRFDEPYTAANRRYDVVIRYFDERDKQSRLVLIINGQERGEPWRAASDDDSWKTHTIADVPINRGDEIAVQVEREGGERVRIDYVQLNARRPTSRAVKSAAKTLKVAVVQTVVQPRLADNLANVLRFIDRAKSQRCDLVVFPEHVLLPFEAPSKPSKAELDAAFEEIRRRAKSAELCLVFADGYRRKAGGPYETHGVVYAKDGAQAVLYRKNLDAPLPFSLDGVTCNLSVCSDRGYLEHSDVPSVTLGAQIIIDTSGGHGGDDGGSELALIRYRPWAARTGAWVIVSNPVHEDTDFMGRSPWGGGSAIIRPDGSVLAKLTYEKDAMIVEEIDTSLASRAAAKQRLNHPLFKPFWEQGKSLLVAELARGPADVAELARVPARSLATSATTRIVKPFTSDVRDITIAAAQIACSREINDNVERIRGQIARAAEQKADIVVFPELAVTGWRADDIRAASAAALDGALGKISDECKRQTIFAIVGMPLIPGDARHNAAVVIGDDGGVKTRYAQLAVSRTDLFKPGTSADSLWFRLKGVPSIVTVGDDANWVEIGNLAAGRGMYLHFHISYESEASTDLATLRKQRNLLALSYARYGAVVNGANPRGLKNPSAPASGGSMIVSREGGHNQPAPDGIEYYLPYQTSIVKSAGAEPALILATRRTSAANNMDLARFWRNRNRRQGGQPSRYDWIINGATMIGGR